MYNNNNLMYFTIVSYFDLLQGSVFEPCELSSKMLNITVIFYFNKKIFYNYLLK